MQLRGGKGRKSMQGERGLARDGARWPSGARPSRPSQKVQVAGRLGKHFGEKFGEGQTQNLFWIWFLCAFASLR